MPKACLLMFATAIVAFGMPGCAAFIQNPAVPIAPITPAWEPTPQRTVLASDEVRIPIHLINGLPYTAVNVGKSTRLFLIDTGCAGGVVVLPQLAAVEELANLGATARDDGAGGLTSGNLTHLLSISTGGLRFDDLEATVARVPGIDPRNNSADIGGILGWEAFSDVLLTVDYVGRCLVVRRGELPPPDGRNVLPIRRRDQGLFIPVLLDRTELWLYPDTGWDGTVVTAAQAASIKWASPPVSTKIGNGLGVTRGTMGRTDGELKIGRYIVRRPLVAVDGSRTFGVLGGNVLGNSIVTFDFRNMRIRFERPSDASVEPEVPTTQFPP